MKNKYDDLMIQGLTTLKNIEFAYVDNIEEIDYNFSEKYIKSKEKLIKNLGRSYWKYINTVAKKVAVIIVALIIAFSSLMTVDAIREKFVSFVYNIYDIFTEIIEDNSTQKVDLDKYFKPKNIDYHIETIQCLPKLLLIIWNNEHNQSISFKQSNISIVNQFNSEYGEPIESIIDDTPCLICKTNTDYFCYWEFDGYRFELIYPLDLGEEFMSEVVGNLVEIDPDELND